MPTILETIAAYARERVQKDQETVPAEEMHELAKELGKGNGEAFKAALARKGMSLICEVKKASPSKGVIDEKFPYTEIAADYEAGGADAVSCLTEPKWFLGSDRIFSEIREEIRIPMLRKDFTVDDYQIDQARVLGADAVLLICALHDTATLAKRLERCDDLGLAALVEAHNEDEIASAAAAGAKIIGVNNRNLKDFSVDFSNAARLRSRIPADALYVAESGVKNPEDIKTLCEAGADAVLVGEMLMRADNRRQMLKRLRCEAE